jgi:hypothetical protein
MTIICKLKCQPYDVRMRLIQALNECGYGTYIEIEGSAYLDINKTYFIVIYDPYGGRETNIEGPKGVK